MLTDRYEMTMLSAALRDGTADARCVFEVFARRLPEGRRYGVVAGTGRVLDAIESFGVDGDDLRWLCDNGVVDDAAAEFLADYRFTGDVDGYPEGELFFPNSPILTVRGSFAETIVLETVILSILNHDAAVAAGAARMVTAAQGRPIIEMGSRRTHERAAIAAARAAYLAGFASTSNLAAGRLHGIPTGGTAAHAFTLLHGDEPTAFRSQVARHGAGTTLLVDTYDITQGIANAAAAAGPELGAIRIDSGDLGVLAHQARAQLDALGNTSTRIVVSGDLDEYAIAGLTSAPVDIYGAGTAVVVGSGAPTAGLVYKLVEVDGRAVAKRSEAKVTNGSGKVALRTHRPTGTAIEEVVVAGPDDARDEAVAAMLASDAGMRRVDVSLIVGGMRTDAGSATLVSGRTRLRETLRTLPWEGLALSRGEPALATRFITVG
ncbi:MAG: nicotinate phosphoribosyltransferase [Ilumatobacteraceae bacterium]|nr:nicotinate phosphoribosyltransferase [Ilumatobacteraceae bacterium]